jgi:hypothetical protein
VESKSFFADTMSLLSGRTNVDVDAGSDVAPPGPYFAALYITKTTPYHKNGAVCAVTPKFAAITLTKAQTDFRRDP